MQQQGRILLRLDALETRSGMPDAGLAARNIHPAFLEALALRHDAIEKAAAVPVGDARLGERVCLAIVTLRHSALRPV